MNDIAPAHISSSTGYPAEMLPDDNKAESGSELFRADSDLFGEDWDEVEPGDPSEPLTKDEPEAYGFSDGKINGVLREKLAAGELDSNPVEVLSFIAKNTNPGYIYFAWENFVEAIVDCFEKRSLSPLFEKGFTLNCVYCTRAVDLTLHQIMSTLPDNAQEPTLLQVAERDSCAITTIFKNIDAISSRNSDGRYLDELKTKVSAGQRACITVPVTGIKAKFSHAMNLINLGPSSTESRDRFFVICGQSGRVFDLQNEADVDAFYARHTSDLPDPEYDVKFVISSDEQEQADDTLQELNFRNKPAIATTFDPTAFA